jgi:hypothetical protein
VAQLAGAGPHCNYSCNPYSKAKNNKGKDNAKNTKTRTSRKIDQVSKAAKEQNKAQHVSTGRGSISRIYLEQSTYTAY